jgi:putative membrane protein
LNLLRGALIGLAEVIPGVSGGTVALVVGVYQRIVSSASSFLSATVALITLRPGLAKQRFAGFEWRFILTLLFGMFFAVLAGAALIEPLLLLQPELTRALFAGLIFASLYVPYKLAGTWKSVDLVLAFVAAALAFYLTSLPRLAEFSPQLWQVIGGAAIAICALVLPGVSGSFLLLALGLYGPTLSAVNDRDFGYLGLFILGAVIGLASFVSLLQYLLTNHKHFTMVLMTGLMAGSLRALWPWQSETGAIEPADNLVVTGSVFLLGVAIVAALITAETRFAAKD